MADVPTNSSHPNRSSSSVQHPAQSGAPAAATGKASASPLPAPTLPKGGGAIRDIGEKFSANPATGAGSLSVPIFTSPGRGGFHPELTLQYDSGKGNGPFGMGWSLSVPRITRRTDKGLPRYLDASDSDTFILSGAEDLVPALTATGERDELPANDPQTGDACQVLRYRPRVESLYARIERWTRVSDGSVYWRSITKDNIASVYGRSSAACISDPGGLPRIFSWLLEETRDGKGNVIRYEYKPEDQQNINGTIGVERARPVANAYLKRIYYGNQLPDIASDWHFQVLFDYGEHDGSDPINGPLGVWPGRQDPFSDFRSTFEVRTYRLCRRVLMVHNFVDLAPDWTVVRSTELTYEENAISTYLRSITQRGWIRRNDNTYDDSEALPSIDVDYSRPKIEPVIHIVDPDSLASLPEGIDGKSYQLLDLDSEGLPGILTEQAEAFLYKRNDGDGHFGVAKRLAKRPSIAELGSGIQQITDLDSSGGKFLVQLGQSPQGYFERRDDSWASFHPFQSLPNLDWSSGELKYLDIDGDGLPDLLRPEGNLFRWWGSLGRNGYGDEHRVSQPHDDDKGPYVVWTDPQQAILIADMTGDGLPDIVRITNGSVSYWPNRGYGRFGAQVVMRNAPRFAQKERFNPAFLRLADIDGSGTADLIYLASDNARVWLNQSGNGYSIEERVPFPSPADNSVMVSDLLGKGTACLVWSSPLPGNQGRQMRYVDLMSGIKPHLLTSMKNNLGATTTITYLPSTKFYLDDRKAGLPWVTKLPFPMHVVSTVEIDEAVTDTQIVTTYRYHHGHYDGIEREFAGFGMVEQEDSEVVQTDSEIYTSPKRTKTWFHTGAFLGAETISTQYLHEYNGDFPQLVPDSLLPPDLTGEEAREAARALRGHVLRTEVYGLDGSPLEPHPYLVTESNFEVRRLQPKGGNRYGSFCVHPRETLTAHTERNPADPHLEHELTLTVDDFGNILESVHIGYGRQSVSSDQPQARTLATYAQHDFVLLTDGANFYRVDLLRESHTYELTGLPMPSVGPTYQRSEVIGFIDGDPSAKPPLLPPVEIDFALSPPVGTRALRLIERTKHIYLGDQVSDDKLLALGLPVEVRRAALTPTLINSVYQSRVTDQVLRDNRYLDEDGFWWAPSGQTEYAAGLFYQAIRMTDPFGSVSAVSYDDPALMVKSATSALQTTYETTVGVQNDYRVLAPSLITDANGNRTQAAFDALGRVTATWVMGKATEQKGDDASHPSTRFEYHDKVIPSFVYVEKREEHYFTDPSNQKLQRAYTYSDGLGREVLTKKQAELDANGNPQWVGSGRVVFDNKGNPVKKYEPYFSPNPDNEVNFNGVTDLLHYDPLSRVVRIDHPNYSYSRVEFDAWTQTAYDENDTVGEPNNGWYADATTGQNATPETQDAAAKALAHANTPTTIFVDALGRTVTTQQHNGFDSSGKAILFPTTVDLDIQGNQRAVTDARGVTVATHVFDMLGRKLFIHSVDAGDSTVLYDAMGAVAHEWNPNSVQIEREYDPLRRPRRVFATEVVNGTSQRRLAERTFYGETLTDGAAHNLRGRVYRQLDGAGMVTLEYDFKSNVIGSTRQLAQTYDQTTTRIGWFDAPDPQNTGDLPPDIVNALVPNEQWPTATTYDALNRITQLVLPSSSASAMDTVLPTYNEAGLLETLGVKLAGSAQATSFVTDIDYNEKGQRLKIVYASGVYTSNEYDKKTFRLSSISTFKTSTIKLPDLQALSYTYDPVGNITTIGDQAQQTYFVGNSVVKPTMKYTYDAIYRLINAQGREHAGQAGMDQTSTPDGVPLPNPNDLTAMRNYAEKYQYDAVGNFLSMIHQVPDAKGQWGNAWTRTYTPDTQSNRLLSTTVGDGSTSVAVTYLSDDGGNIKQMQGGSLSVLDWDCRNRLIHAVSSKGDSYFTYDAAGQRVRKVLVNGGTIKERIYLGTYEIYRERPAAGGAATLERRTLHVNDDKRRVVLVETLTIGTPATANALNDGPAQLIRYQLDNHLGSAMLELKGDGGIASYEEYHPYGTTAYRATASDLARNPKRYAFAAKERDEETGLYYYGARYYAPWLGRWTSADPAGMVDGPSRYWYCRNNPVRLKDPTGMQSADAQDKTTWHSGDVRTVGQFKAWAKAHHVSYSGDVTMEWVTRDGTQVPVFHVHPAEAPAAPPPANKKHHDANPLSAIKTYSAGPNKNVVWRKTNPSVDPDPLRNGFSPKDPNANYSLGEHALNQHAPNGSQYVSASKKPGGAENIKGEPYAIDVKKTEAAGTKMHDTPTIEKDLGHMAQEGKVSPERVEMWKNAQRGAEGGEVLFQGKVPASAIESVGMRMLKGFGRLLFWGAVAATVYDLGKAAKQSIDEGSARPLAREALRQAGTWGGVAAGAKLGAFVGSFLGPVGTIVGGIAGGLIGGIGGYLLGNWLGNRF
jgi:RHS repeat-associated protein